MAGGSARSGWHRKREERQDGGGQCGSPGARGPGAGQQPLALAVQPALQALRAVLRPHLLAAVGPGSCVSPPPGSRGQPWRGGARSGRRAAAGARPAGTRRRAGSSRAPGPRVFACTGAAPASPRPRPGRRRGDEVTRPAADSTAGEGLTSAPPRSCWKGPFWDLSESAGGHRLLPLPPPLPRALPPPARPLGFPGSARPGPGRARLRAPPLLGMHVMEAFSVSSSFSCVFQVLGVFVQLVLGPLASSGGGQFLLHLGTDRGTISLGGSVCSRRAPHSQESTFPGSVKQGENKCPTHSMQTLIPA